MATVTSTQETLMGDGGSTLRVESSLPPKLPSDFLSDYPKLSNEQAGYLRHFHNLATQPDGEWRHMGTQDPGQEWLDAYRYQLAVMAYAAGASHYHRLPALRSVFKQLLEQLIHKMLRREVWGYWYLTSQSGKFVDPDIVELRKPWSDPNKKENIMVGVSRTAGRRTGEINMPCSIPAIFFSWSHYTQCCSTMTSMMRLERWSSFGIRSFGDLGRRSLPTPEAHCSKPSSPRWNERNGRGSAASRTAFSSCAINFRCGPNNPHDSVFSLTRADHRNAVQ